MKDLTPEKSKIVQETLFKNGYSWGNSSNIIQALNAKHLILKNEQLYQGNNNDVFLYDAYKDIPELTFEEFERLYVNKEPSKEDLLAEARRRYTKPCVVDQKTAYKSGYKYDIKDVTNIKISEIKGIFNVSIDGVGVYTSNYKIWAEIVQDTLKVSDLVEGEIYFGRYSGCDVIFKPKQCEIYNNKEFFNSNVPTKITELRVVTQEEKDWLNASIMCNKFIEKSIALQLMQYVKELDTFLDI
jgi:hypothetical protein